MTRETERSLNHMLLATDFSSRSDRAASRALLLAKQFDTRITIVHVVDDDQPKRLIESARDESEGLLASMRDTFREVHGVDCETTVAIGEAFAGALAVADERGVDIIVVGPHRRQILKDVFTGTTAERIIRQSRRPVLMVNGPPSAQYRSILVATDLSDASGPALRFCGELRPGSKAGVAVGHVFDAPASSLMRRASVAQGEIDDYVAQEQARAADALRAFLQKESFRADQVLVRPNRGSVAAEIEAMASECSADLVVAGTHGRTGLSKILLGSVTEELMRHSSRDVLAVPPPD